MSETTRAGNDAGPPRPTNLFPLTRQTAWPLTRLLIRTPVTPNQVTALSLLTGLAGAGCFAWGTRAADFTGALVLVLAYTLDNCDGAIARYRNIVSELGARLDDAVDWLTDTAFFAALGHGVWIASGEIVWLWLGLAAALGATIDFGVDMSAVARRKREGGAQSGSIATPDPPMPRSLADRLLFIAHSLSRADFCFVVLLLVLADFVWILLPFGAIGAQIYWMVDLYKHARRRTGG